MDKIGWNPFNDSEQAVLESQKVSFYKGVPIYKYDGPKGKSGSCFIIMLDRDDKRSDTIRHEWGHAAQMMLMGAGNFLLTVGIMSPLELRADKWCDYYKSPWETGADYLGMVQSRNHTDSEILRALLYMILGGITPFAAYFYLL